jgi:hypothetical protein
MGKGAAELVQRMVPAVLSSSAAFASPPALPVRLSDCLRQYSSGGSCPTSGSLRRGIDNAGVSPCVFRSVSGVNSMCVCACVCVSVCVGGVLNHAAQGLANR